jgi:hypothetical protein
MRLVRRSRLAFRGCEITAPGESDLNTQWKLIWAIWVVKGKFDGGVIANGGMRVLSVYDLF